MKERLAMLDIEMSNASWLLTLNSCAGNYHLKTFLGSTESVMVEELGESQDEVRRWTSFQTLSKLKNYSTCTQNGESTKCHLGRLPVWPMKGRREGDALTLSQYSAEVEKGVEARKKLHRKYHGWQKVFSYFSNCP